jgi:hypothetical protein
MSTDHIDDVTTESAATAQPLSISGLVVAASNLLDQAADLPQPRYITISRLQNISMAFTHATEGVKELGRWALRFGGEETSQPYEGDNGPETLCRLDFDYCGLAVQAYAFVPAGTATI